MRARVEEALREDAAHGDCTVHFLEISGVPITARLVAGASGVIAGLDVARLAFDVLDPATAFASDVGDGDRVDRDQTVARISGKAGTILSAERVALNFLQRLSGIATLTAQFVERVSKTGVRILDTRKTTPLLRALERYAVEAGGGANHRFDLQEMILVKENHVRAMGGPEALRDFLAERAPGRTIEVEVDSIDFLKQLLGSPIDRFMLDNFEPREVGRAVRAIRSYTERHPDWSPTIEASGGITLDNVTEYASQGVDEVSIGALTHSAPALDFSLEVVNRGDR